jgi:hypothetical protein
VRTRRPVRRTLARGRLDGVLNYDMAIRDTKFAGNRFRIRLAGSLRKGRFSDLCRSSPRNSVSSGKCSLTLTLRQAVTCDRGCGSFVVSDERH